MTATSIKARPERWLGFMYAIAALLCPIALAVPHSAGYHPVGILATALIGLAVGAGLLFTPGHPGPLVLHAVVAFGSFLTGAIIAFTGGLPNSASLFFIWIVLYAFYVFGLRAAICHLVLVLAIYVACVVFLPADYPLASHSVGIIGALVGAGVIVAALKRQVNDLLETVAKTALTDELTGLANRRAFNEELDRELARMARSGAPLTLATLDLDRFKEVNDQLGHPDGDSTLVRVGEVLRSSVRDADLPARVGGEEFSVILPDTDAEGAARLAERLRRCVAETFAEDPVPVTASIGLASTSRDDAVGATELLRRADRALYAAKEAGRDRVELFDAVVS